MLAEIQQTFNGLEDKLGKLQQQLDLMSADSVYYKAGAEKWSVVEAIEHLVIAEEGMQEQLSAGDSAANLDPQDRSAKNFQIVIKVMERDIPVDVPDESMEPHGEFKLNNFPYSSMSHGTVLNLLLRNNDSNFGIIDHDLFLFNPQIFDDLSFKKDECVIGAFKLRNTKAQLSFPTTHFMFFNIKRIHRMGPDRKLQTLFKDPQKLRWPDGFSFGPRGFLYVTDRSLQNVIMTSAGKIRQTRPYYVYRFDSGYEAVPGH
jgi:hypothetical protein